MKNIAVKIIAPPEELDFSDEVVEQIKQKDQVIARRQSGPVEIKDLNNMIKNGNTREIAKNHFWMLEYEARMVQEYFEKLIEDGYDQLMVDVIQFGCDYYSPKEIINSKKPDMANCKIYEGDRASSPPFSYNPEDDYVTEM